MFDNKIILVTGGTGSFGHMFVEKVLSKYNPTKIIIFSRDEMKQWKMAEHFSQNKKLRFFIGDIRDEARLRRAMKQVDIVIHAAATKIVPVAEYNPNECIKTNVIGGMNVVEACLDCDVDCCVALSTDKASSPINLYGASKLASDKLFIAGNSYSGQGGTRFSVVRYGNVMGSRGSIIPFLMSLASSRKTPITHPNMTRFMISLEDAVEQVFYAAEDSIGGELYVRKNPSMNIVDLAKTVRPDAEIEYVGIRPGEKLHEQMIGLDDADFTYEYPQYFKILPMLHDWHKDENRIKDGRKVNNNFSYNSQENVEWLEPKELLDWIYNNKKQIGLL
jgi:UDP-N-acetylglucosamine 4,6-dehydratase (inverting)